MILEEEKKKKTGITHITEIKRLSGQSCLDTNSFLEQKIKNCAQSIRNQNKP